jgi:quaternary ammonium compound-resistance protein SugE
VISALNPSTAQAWLLLAVAGVLEIVWVVGLKYADGFTRPAASMIVLVTALLSFYLLGLAVKVLPVGTAYAVWVGIGAAGAALFGVILFSEPAGLLRLTFIALIITGVAGLRIVH